MRPLCWNTGKPGKFYLPPCTCTGSPAWVLGVCAGFLWCKRTVKIVVDNAGKVFKSSWFLHARADGNNSTKLFFSFSSRSPHLDGVARQKYSQHSHVLAVLGCNGFSHYHFQRWKLKCQPSLHQNALWWLKWVVVGLTGLNQRPYVICSSTVGQEQHSAVLQWCARRKLCTLAFCFRSLNLKKGQMTWCPDVPVFTFYCFPSNFIVYIRESVEKQWGYQYVKTLFCSSDPTFLKHCWVPFITYSTCWSCEVIIKRKNSLN